MLETCAWTSRSHKFFVRWTGNLLWMLLLAGTVAWADHLSSPTGAILLSVDGDITHTNAENAAHFDRTMLEALGMTELRTSTPWTDGRRSFSGIHLERLLQTVGAQGNNASARALNDYVVNIPLEPAVEKGAFLALGMDGNYLSVRNKGPIWLIFPWDEDPSLDDQTTKHQSIWQLRYMTIE